MMNLFSRQGPRLALALGVMVAVAGCGQDAGDDVPNRPPTIGGVPNVQVDAGAAYSFTPRAEDPDGDSLTFRAENLPSWATLNATTGAITGTPGDADVGTSGMITIEVTDNESAAQLEPFQIEVRPRTSGTTPPPSPPNVNRAPTISGTPSTSVVAGAAYSFQPAAVDPDGDNLTYSIESLPAWASFSTSTGRLTGTPAAGNVGSYAGIVIRVSDGSLTAALPAFTLQVTSAPIANRPPVISGTPPASVVAGSAYSFAPTASDPDGNTLTFSIQNRPTWASFDTATGRLTGTPTTSQLGTFSNIAISVSDGTTAAALAPFSITVTQAANRPPVISGTPPTTVTAGQAYTFTPTASDPDGNTLTFSIANAPAWATFDAATGRLSGTPTAANVGSTSGVTITVSDGRTTASLAAFSIAVAAASSGSATLTWVAPTTNNDNSPLTDLSGYRIEYGRSATNLDQFANVNTAGVTTYRVENLSSGTWYFAVRALSASGRQSNVSNIASLTVN